MLWIRIAFGFKADPDPAFLSMRIQIRIQELKIAICFSQGLSKGRPSYKRSLHPLKENIQHFKNWNLFTVVGYFGPPESGFGSADHNDCADTCGSGTTDAKLQTKDIVL